MRRVKPFRLSRRALIRGGAYALALPWLEAMAPRKAFAQSVAPARRVLFFFFSTGYKGGTWNFTPGADWKFPTIAAALEPLKKKTTLITGMNEQPGSVGSGGAGIHARATGCFLVHAPLRTSGFDGDGISADQVIAAQIGKDSCIPSLVLGIPGEKPATFAEDGYGNVYLNNISFKGPKSAVTKESNPSDLFKRLVTCPAAGAGSGQAGTMPNAALEERVNFERSVMTSVKDEAQKLIGCVGQADRLRVEEYFNSIAELERRFRAPTEPTKPGGSAPSASCSMPNPVTGDPGVALKAGATAMFDLLTTAFKCNLTKVSTLMLDGAFSRRNYGLSDINGANYIHGLSHGEISGKAADHPRWVKITTHYFELLAQLLKQMDSVNEGEGTMLDNSIVYIGSEYGDGDAHSFNNQPMILAGGGGKLKMGQHIATSGMPQANAVLDVINAMGVSRASFGNSSGRVPGLAI
jgi:Protein of unknown function (DUF1552)